MVGARPRVLSDCCCLPSHFVAASVSSSHYCSPSHSVATSVTLLLALAVRSSQNGGYRGDNRSGQLGLGLPSESQEEDEELVFGDKAPLCAVRATRCAGSCCELVGSDADVAVFRGSAGRLPMHECFLWSRIHLCANGHKR